MPVDQQIQPSPKGHPTLHRIFSRIIGAQIAYGLIVIFVIGITHFNQLTFTNMAKKWPMDGYVHWESELATWDAAHYLFLAQNGYRQGDPSCAFYPAWPMLIWAVSRAGFPLLLVGITLANILFVLAACLFYTWIRDEHPDFALASCSLLFVFPGSLFFRFPYSESLFLLGEVLLLIGLQRRSVGLCASSAFLLPMIRAVGIFSILPLGYIAWRDRRFLLPIFSCFVGYACYFFIQYEFTGSPFSGFDAQKFFPNNPSIMNIVRFDKAIAALCDVDFRGMHTMQYSPIDRLFFLFYCSSLPWLFRRSRILFFLSIGLGIIPALSNQFLSYTRFSSVNLPFLIWMGAVIVAIPSRPLRGVIWAGLVIVHLFLLSRYLSFRWAG